MPPPPDIAPRESIRIAIVGATGAVGQELLTILRERNFPGRRLRLLASVNSAGRTLAYGDDLLTVEELTDSSFDSIDIAFFSAGGDVSRRFASIAVSSGATVIDNSSAFRLDEDVPLIVPEINGNVLEDFPNPGAGVIANPNCSTIIALMAIAPLHKSVSGGGVERMVISTYQAASGGGAAMMRELEQQAFDYVQSKPLTREVLDRQYLFNLFSHDSRVDPETGYNEEERKLICETHKILGDDRVAITATCVRVPVLRAHSEAINLTFRDSLSEDEARAILAAAPGVRLVDDRCANKFPEPIDASGSDDILVGRIRADISQPPGKGLDLFVSGDQLRKGAALNAIQIAERLVVREQVQT